MKYLVRKSLTDSVEVGDAIAIANRLCTVCNVSDAAITVIDEGGDMMDILPGLLSKDESYRIFKCVDDEALDYNARTWSRIKFFEGGNKGHTYKFEGDETYKCHVCGEPINGMYVRSRKPTWLWIRFCPICLETLADVIRIENKLQTKEDE